MNSIGAKSVLTEETVPLKTPSARADFPSPSLSLEVLISIRSLSIEKINLFPSRRSIDLSVDSINFLAHGVINLYSVFTVKTDILGIRGFLSVHAVYLWKFLSLSIPLLDSCDFREVSRVCAFFLLMEGRDYISCLPDLMLLHVLRFLPTVDAARTVCVPRFRYLWKLLPNLSFNLCEFHRCSELGLNQTEFRERFIDFVNSALILHDRPTLDRFSLSMEFRFTVIGPDMVNGGNGIRPSRVSSMIGLWIHFALRKKVRILNLDFSGCQDDTEGEDPGSEYYVLPSIVLRSRSLAELYLDRCSVKLFGGIQLKSLRILWLTRVGLSNQMVNQILSGCPLLEELSLKMCSGLDHLKIPGPTRLKKLDVAIANINELDIALSSIEFLKVHADLAQKIICPKITHLDIDVNLKHVRFSDLPSVIEATIFLNKSDMIQEEEFQSVRFLLQKLRNVTSLKACAVCVMVFSVWELANHPRPCFNWTRLTTVHGFSKWAIFGISRFLMSSPRLESLVIYAFPFSPSLERMEPDDLDIGYDCSAVDGGTFHCLKDHLKNITIQGDITKPYIVDLIKFLLGNALVLEKMVISGESPPERYRKKYQYDCSVIQNPRPPISMVELSQMVSGFRRASALAEVHLA